MEVIDIGPVFAGPMSTSAPVYAPLRPLRTTRRAVLEEKAVFLWAVIMAIAAVSVAVL